MIIDEFVKDQASLSAGDTGTKETGRGSCQADQSVIKNEELMSKFMLVEEMSASLVHEIRNPMAIVRGLAQLLIREDPKHREYYEIMLEEMDRANRLLNNFLSLARDNVNNFGVIDLNELLQKSMSIMYAELVGNKIILLSQYDLSAPAYIYGDADKIKQAIINISRNAIEAMAPGGTLRVKTKIQNEEVWVSFIDNGCGISADIIQKIMQPFFSTKTYGTGWVCR
jgi:signal transduction histidine kinase